MSSACIDYLVDEGCRIIVFGTCLVHVSEVSKNLNGALFLHDGYKDRKPRCVSNRVDETNLMKLVDFLFNHFFFRWVELTLLFS